VRCLVCGTYACVLVARRVCWGGTHMGLVRLGLITVVNNRMCVWIIRGGCKPNDVVNEYYRGSFCCVAYWYCMLIPGFGRGYFFFHFGIHLLDFLKADTYQPLGLSTPILFAKEFVCKKHQNTFKHVIWCIGWSSVDIWLLKVGFTPRKIKHGLAPRDGWFSSSSAVGILQVLFV